MTHGTRLGVLMAALALFGAGCATVDWTEDLFAKQKVEVDTRFDKVETSVREQGERIDRVEVRVANLDTRVSETHDLVRKAIPQAPTPAQMRPTARHQPPHTGARQGCEDRRGERSRVGRWARAETDVHRCVAGGQKLLQRQRRLEGCGGV